MKLLSLLLTTMLLLGALTAAETQPEATQEEAPRLVVMLAIDQLSGELLDRYDEIFTGGLRRILDQGFHFTQANHFHANTETAAGHAALSTGVLPHRNGIVANSWREQVGSEWKSVYAVSDSASPIAGVPSLPGRSPANLFRGGIADWMQAQHPDSKVLSVSRKDRAAITLVGQTSDAHVYWLVPGAGRWVTSTYYRDEYSRWFERFHSEVLPGIFGDSVWTSSIPPGLERLSRGDTAVFEGNGLNTYFPHSFANESEATPAPAFHSWASGTPMVDKGTLALAESGMRALELGQDNVPDYLALSLSQTDIVGHSFGPFSREQLDNLLRLDQALGEFLVFLDDYVGEGRWVLGFSADHGVLPAPEYLEASGRGGMRTSQAQVTELVTAVQQAATAGDGSPPAVANRVKRAVEDIEWIEAVYTAWDLRDGEPADTFEILYENSYLPERVTGFFGELGVLIRPRARVLVTTSPRGTSHGSPYWYDRHVPLIFLGAGVEPGSSSGSARTIDMAPTLAALAGITAPDDLDGQSLFP